jgi:S1-C subfamily serine protease
MLIEGGGHPPGNQVVNALLHSESDADWGSYKSFDRWSASRRSGAADSPGSRLVTMHEALHVVLNETTAFGAMLLACQVLDRTEGAAYRAHLLRLVSYCRRVHEAYATFLSLGLVAGDQSYLPGDSRYQRWYRDASDLVPGPDHSRRKELMVEAAARVCMQAPVLARLTKNVTPEAAAWFPPAAERPDLRFALLHRVADQAFWTRAWDRCAAQVADTAFWAAIEASDDDITLRTETYDDRVSDSLDVCSRMLYAEVAGLLAEHGVPTLGYDGHRNYTAAVIEAVERASPAARGMLVASSDERSVREDAFEMWRQERLVDSPPPAVAVDSQALEYLGQVLNKEGTPVGTSFQAAPGILVTARHILEGLLDDEIGALVRVASLQGGPARSARVLHLNRSSDLAILELAEPFSGLVIGFAASDELPSQEPVTITGVEFNANHDLLIGYALGLWIGPVIHDNARRGLVKARGVTPGMSGAPVLRRDGRVVGVVSAVPSQQDTISQDQVLVTRAEDIAIPLFKHTLASRRRVLGEDHPDTLASANDLAGAYRLAGRLGEAIPLLEQTLASRRRVLGEDHPDTLASDSNLAYAYRSAGRLGEAIPLFEQTLSTSFRILGARHLSTLAARSNLASALLAAGRVKQALPLLKETLIDRENVLGLDHPDTLTSRNNLALGYESLERLGEAIPLFEQTLSDSTRVLGPDHPNTLVARSNLANVGGSPDLQGGATDSDLTRDCPHE